jgi:hypothetical protein
MSEWWHALSTAQQVFWGIAILGSLLLLVQIILMLAGLDGHDDLHIGDADAGGQGDHTSGLSFLSIRSIIAFIAGFGWAGVAAMQAGAGVAIAALAALAVGVLLMFTVFWIMRSMTRLSCSGSLDYRNAVGQGGAVYITIPAAMAGPGQVEVLIQGRLCTAQAMTRAAAPLAPRAKVKVVELIDRTTLLVEPLV